MSGFTLKILACAFMLTDHVAEFLPGMPIWMHYIGRLAAPIFAFLIGEGMEHTRSKPRYALRLYIASVLMSFVQFWLDIGNNAFTTLFQTALVIGLLSAETIGKRVRNIAMYAAYQFAVGAVIWHVGNTIDFAGSSTIPESVMWILTAATGSVIGVEGGLIWVAIGVALWIARRSKPALAITFAGMTVLQALMVSPIAQRGVNLLDRRWLTPNGITAFGGGDTLWGMSILQWLGTDYFTMGASYWEVNYQWMMIFAMPFMLLYNGKRGLNAPAAKWLFYVFYPTHILILYFVAFAMTGEPPTV